ncbi:penicillin-binding transpeptidase domain-containing protein [Streptomyces sp. NPDC093984]|uniref:penicillin-binding transpeptidase domain-containing protein n=1 Tax=Streptomyces sp. NPDC093984 TaxID=3366052 RepID=UPI00381D2044
MGKRRRVAGRNNSRPLVIGGLIAVVGLGGAVGAYSLLGGGAAADDRNAAPGHRKLVRIGPPSASEVRTTATAFLTAWQQGDAAKAAGATDDSAAATAALTGYRKDAHITGVTLTPGTPTGATVPFSVKATVSYKGVSKPFTYDSKLTVVRRADDGVPLVRWQPSVLHPDLTAGDRLVTGEAGTPPVKTLDRDGGEITAAKYPSLGTVLDGLREKYGKKAGGKAGIELRIVRKAAAKGKEKTPDKTLVTLSEGTPGTLKTTLSPTLQAAAEQQVAKQANASVVVMRPSTGEILAVANTSHGFNVAFQGSLAPGSTMKIITSTMLFEKGLVTPEASHPCPKTYKLAGWTFHNDDDSEIKQGSFKLSFAASCNNAFINFAPKLSNSDLTEEAQQVYGLGLDNWSIGVPTFDGSIPVQSGAQMGASLIGQGGVRMNPLNMASVASTVKTGVFHQPYLVSPTVDDRTLAKASRTMSAKTQSELKEVMQYTAAYGTAAKAMAGLGPDYGAKTGSAEVDGQKKPNGWFTAYKGDLAAAGVVQAGGHGGDTAGPIVAALLRAGS